MAYATGRPGGQGEVMPGRQDAIGRLHTEKRTSCVKSPRGHRNDGGF